jgi:hypothetical protein
MAPWLSSVAGCIKTINILDKMPKSVQGKAKQLIQPAWNLALQCTFCQASVALCFAENFEIQDSPCLLHRSPRLPPNSNFLIVSLYAASLTWGTGRPQETIKIGVSVPSADHAWTGGIDFFAQETKQRIRVSSSIPVFFHFALRE